MTKEAAKATALAEKRARSAEKLNRILERDERSEQVNYLANTCSADDARIRLGYEAKKAKGLWFYGPKNRPGPAVPNYS